MDELKNQLAQYLCSQIHNGTKDLIELIELLFEEWYIHRHERELKLKSIVQLADVKDAKKIN